MTQTTDQIIPSLSDADTTSAELARIAAGIQQERQPADPAPESSAKEVATPTGLLNRLVVAVVNSLFSRNSITPLSQAEENTIKQPLDEIESRYMPALMQKYADKYAPFLELAIAAYFIYETRRLEIEKRKPQEQPQEQMAQPKEGVENDQAT